jgi:molybdopterin synthase sulfur carrier subunit
MKIRVKYFASFREKTGKREEEIVCVPGTRLQSLVETLKDKYGFGPRILISLNHEFGKNEELHDGDVVALFPPVSGG